MAWPSIAAVERMAHERMGGGPPASDISDDDALAVDKAVSELTVARPEEGNALALYYLTGTNYRKLAKDLGKHHQQVANMVDSGKMWVEGRLIGSLS